MAVRYITITINQQNSRTTAMRKEHFTADMLEQRGCVSLWSVCPTYHMVRGEVDVPWKNQDVAVEMEGQSSTLGPKAWDYSHLHPFGSTIHQESNLWYEYKDVDGVISTMN